MDTFEEIKQDKIKQRTYLASLKRGLPFAVSEVVNDPSGSNIEDYLTHLRSQRIITDGFVTDMKAEIKRILPTTAFYVLHVPKLYGRGYGHPVFVFNGFSMSESEDHFKSMLLDHETVHNSHLLDGVLLDPETKLSSQNLCRVRNEVLEDFSEFLAYQNQFRLAPQRRLDDGFVEGIYFRMNGHLDSLLQNPAKTDLEAKMQDYALRVSN